MGDTPNPLYIKLHLKGVLAFSFRHGFHAGVKGVGSRRVLEKAGYKPYGIARKHEWRTGKWHDKWLADLLADEWFAAQNRKE